MLKLAAVDTIVIVTMWRRIIIAGYDRKIRRSCSGRD